LVSIKKQILKAYPYYPHWLSRGYELYRNILAGLHSKFDRSYFRVWNPWFLDRSQWFSEEEIRHLQLEGLKKLVDHARRNTRYYKGLPNIESLDDLEKIPILTKREIRENFNRLRARNVPGFKVVTAGTVGKSTTIKDKRLSDRFDFGKQRFLSWYRTPLKRHCLLWSLYDIGKSIRQTSRHLYLPTDSLKTGEDAIYYLKLIERFRPDFIQGYANPLRFLAHYALEEGIQPEVGVIQTDCETLFPEARKEIERAFRCDVYNFYGSRELGSMGQDCEVHGDLHINAERYIVEEADDRLIFTDLLNYAMPLIRYENQDTGKLSGRRCLCGRGLPTLSSIIGRTYDYLLTKKDTWMYMIFMDRLIKQHELFDWVESSQFKQVEKGKVTVLLKPWSDSEKIPDLNSLNSFLYQHVSRDELDISIEIVDSLILSKSGKQIKVLTSISPWDT